MVKEVNIMTYSYKHLSTILESKFGWTQFPLVLKNIKK